MDSLDDRYAALESDQDKLDLVRPLKHAQWATVGLGVKRHSLGTFVDLMHKQGLMVVEMPRDGNCLYRALSTFQRGTSIYHPELRQSVHSWLEQKSAGYKNRLLAANGMTKRGVVRQNWEYHNLKTKQAGDWYNSQMLEVLAAAHVLQVHVEVYSYDSEPIKLFSCGGDANSVLRLALVGHNHYLLLVHGHMRLSDKEPLRVLSGASNTP